VAGHLRPTPPVSTPVFACHVLSAYMQWADMKHGQQPPVAAAAAGVLRSSGLADSPCAEEPKAAKVCDIPLCLRR
jgi:hypothetical protein